MQNKDDILVKVKCPQCNRTYEPTEDSCRCGVNLTTNGITIFVDKAGHEVDYTSTDDIEEKINTLNTLLDKLSKRDLRYKKRYHLFVTLFIVAVFLCTGLVTLCFNIIDDNYNLRNQISQITSSSGDFEEEIEEYEETIQDLEIDLSNLEKDNKILSEKAEWYDENIGIVPEGADVYHKCDCVALPSNCQFKAYNTKLAESMGYTECPECR